MVLDVSGRTKRRKSAKKGVAGAAPQEAMHAGTSAVRTPPRDRIVVTARDLDCSTTGCARETRPTLKPSQRAPYHA
eukprot:546546-Prymnesium_polylepis.1